MSQKTTEERRSSRFSLGGADLALSRPLGHGEWVTPSPGERVYARGPWKQVIEQSADFHVCYQKQKLLSAAY